MLSGGPQRPAKRWPAGLQCPLKFRRHQGEWSRSLFSGRVSTKAKIPLPLAKRTVKSAKNGDLRRERDPLKKKSPNYFTVFRKKLGDEDRPATSNRHTSLPTSIKLLENHQFHGFQRKQSPKGTSVQLSSYPLARVLTVHCAPPRAPCEAPDTCPVS